MEVLNKQDYRLITHLFKMSDKVLLKTMMTFLQKEYKQVIATKEYVYAVGDIPVALVAHLDTVYNIQPSDIYYDSRKGVLWSPQGLGADDRAGVFAILKIVRQGYKPHVIFTMDEEVGGKGATALITEHPKPFAEMKYIIELDRRGVVDCVFYDCDNQLFTQYVESFGFVEAWGSFSDISEICPAWKIAGVNLSIGYQDEHSYSETLHIHPMYKTINRVINMLKDINNVITPYDYIPNQYSYGKLTTLAMATKNFDFADEWVNCAKCKKTFLEYELFPIHTSKIETKMFCPDCVSNNVRWCAECGEPFEIDGKNPNEIKCFICREEKKKNG